MTGRSVQHNECIHCGKEFVLACVKTSLCFVCRETGHVEDALNCPECEKEVRREMEKRS